jgi:hypothetical protein
VFRYYLIATAIVLAVGTLAAALHFGVGHELRVASVQTTASPSPPRAQAASTFDPGAIIGAAPWVFSALSDCFHQERAFHGTFTHLRAEVPRDARPLEASRILESGPCNVYYWGDHAKVLRGPSGDASVDVEVPAHLRIFVQGGPEQATTYARRRIYVLRWTSEAEARLDRLSTMSDSRVETCCKV